MRIVLVLADGDMLADGDGDVVPPPPGFLVEVGLGFGLTVGPVLAAPDAAADAELLAETALSPDEPASFLLFEQAASVAARPMLASKHTADFMPGPYARIDHGLTHLSPMR
jgi:hypothetical protein